MLTADEIERLCTAGSLAPSGGNVQPWRVTVSSTRMEVGTDPDRTSDTMLDVGGYAALFSVGCFAENVRVAAHALGLEHDSAVRPDGTVELTFTGRRDAVAHELHGALVERATNRRWHEGAPLAANEVRRLADVAAATYPGCSVATVSTMDGKSAVAQALGMADALRMRNAVMFADMVREMCWSKREVRERRDGLDPRTLELPASTRGLLSLLRRLPRVRLLLPAARLGDTARALVLGCSHVCCLTIPAAPTPAAMVSCGSAMQRLWLTATRDGISVHPWTVSTLQMIRLESFAGEGFTEAERDAVARLGTTLRGAFGLTPAQTPVFVFRLSKASPPTARSLRRPWRSYTIVTG